MYKLAVIGNPIDHSLSPVVFAKFASQFDLSLSYEKILAKDNFDFAKVVHEFFEGGGFALNITSPFKQEAYKVSYYKTMRSQFSQASNFLRLDQNQDIIADTTDGIGLVKDILDNAGFSLNNKKILIIGSGFVLDSILMDFIPHNPLQIDILARNAEKLNYLKRKYAVSNFNPNSVYDIILNTTPNLPDNQLFNQLTNLSQGTLCYDMAYAQNITLFLNKMKDKNPDIICRNGLGMLVETAKVAFDTLFNVNADSKKVLKQLIQEAH